MINTNNGKTVHPDPPKADEGSNGIDKKLKTAVAISIAFHVVLLSLAIVAAPKRAPGPITIELTTAGLTDKTGLSGKKHAPIKKASRAVPIHASSAPPEADGGHPADEFPAPSPDAVIPPLPVAMLRGNEIPAPFGAPDPLSERVPRSGVGRGKTAEEHPPAGAERQESNTFEAASMSSAEDYGEAENYGGSEDYGNSEDYGGSEGNGGSGVSSIASGNPHTAQFLSLVREKIEKAKFYPPVARKRGYEGVVRVGFTITKNGKLEDLHVLRPCRCEALDSAAIDAIKKASPFSPVPETFPDEGIKLEIDVAYRLTD